jgi:hypothetical protein
MSVRPNHLGAARDAIAVPANSKTAISAGTCRPESVVRRASPRFAYRPRAACDTDQKRLDVHNGLLLSALWDAAFDAGLVSFGDDGAPITSSRLSEAAAAALGLHFDGKLSSLTDAHRANLAWHRSQYGFT